MSKVFLAIIFLFVSHTLFSAYESQVLIKNASSRQMSSEEMREKELYTAELKKLVNKSSSAMDRDVTWGENSSAMQEWIKMGACADIKIPGSISDNSLLHEACFYNCPGLVEVCLVDGGAQIERINRWKQTALFSCRSVRLLEIFLKHGADFNHKNQCKKTALYHAAERHYSVEAIEFLSHHTKLFSDEWGDTPLHGLCNYRNKNFGAKAAILVWWWQDQLEKMDHAMEKPTFYLQKWHPDYVPKLDAIGKEIKQAQAQFPEWQSKQLVKMVNKFIPDVGGIVRSYSGPPLSDVSLRYFMEKEEGSREKYPAIAEALFNYVEPAEPDQPVEPVKSIELVGTGMFGEIAKPIKFVEVRCAEPIESKKEDLDIESVSRPERTPCCPIC